MGLDVAGTLKTVFIMLAIVGFDYFVLPWLMPNVFHQAIYLSITTTIANVVAILLSWYYFSKSGCYGDEANLVAEYSYKIFGAGATHLGFYVSRVTGNILMVILLLTVPDTLVIAFSIAFGIKIFLLSYSIGNAAYIHEAINNLIHVFNGVDYECKERSMMCNVIDDPLFCDGL